MFKQSIFNIPQESGTEGGELVGCDFLRKQHQQLGDGEKDFRIRQQLEQNSLFQSLIYCEGTEP